MYTFSEICGRCPYKILCTCVVEVWLTLSTLDYVHVFGNLWALSTSDTVCFVGDVWTLSTPDTVYILYKYVVEDAWMLYTTDTVYVVGDILTLSTPGTVYVIGEGLMLYTPDNVYFVRRRVDDIHTIYCIPCTRKERCYPHHCRCQILYTL